MNARILSLSFIVAVSAACAGVPAGPYDALDIAGKAFEKREAIAKTATALRKGFSDLSLEEEYYIGRAVAASILSKYKPVEDPARTAYLNTLGQTLSKHSSRPETFAGYHFLLLNSAEVNAFAAPGGFVFVTTGLYAKLKTEEQLAGVLAHEISHVTLKHGLAAIKTANLTQAFTIIGAEAMKEYGARELAELTAAFEDSINDIVNQLVVNGYSRGQEYDADNEALRVAHKAGYDPAGLTEFLGTLSALSGKGGGAGFFKTHPPAGDRLTSAIATVKKESLTGAPEKARLERFKRFAL